MATRRTRSMLVDASIGKIFTNTNEKTPTDPSKLIAGTKLQSTSIAANKKIVARITNNLSGTPTGLRFVSGALITSVAVSAALAPTGSGIGFTFKVGTSYETATTLGTDELPAIGTRKVTTTSWTIPAGSSVYVDITQVGSTRPGNGVGVQFNYYAG